MPWRQNVRIVVYQLSGMDWNRTERCFAAHIVLVEKGRPSCVIESAIEPARDYERMLPGNSFSAVGVSSPAQ